ncbi:methyl-accepting chemotaxis protein [Zoogloea sp.]|uniref:methyl-accepting chemotaxis protein n=1 Tax=Zoogloea sp. TaxID=49181 RepID=UPI0026222032|nr:methyl-accepting chemotaxis protein [Zoogloea sp.]MDD3354959.1 methyl-accepting chemotaxis protein [Zoogloea sp.]
MNPRKEVRVATRIQWLVGLALFGMVVLCITALFELRSTMVTDRQDKLKSQVETALGIMTQIHSQVSAGKLSDAEARQAVKASLAAVRYSGEEYFFLYKADGTSYMHPIKPELEGKSLWDMKDPDGKFLIRELVAAARAGGGVTDYMWERSKGAPPEPRMAYSAYFAPWDLVVGTGVYVNDIDQAYWAGARLLAVMAAALLALLSFFGWRIGSSILRQLGGEPVDAARVMRRVAAGELCVDVPAAPEGSLLHDAGGMVRALRELVSEINDAADRLVKNAMEIAAAAGHISDAAGNQADATSAMAAAIEELTVSSSHISDSADDSARYSTEAVDLARQGTERVDLASRAIQKISDTVSEASGRIHVLEDRTRAVSSIANVIKEIAGQTNLLALNAAIEAARAGEQGRGFAVVADEVRKLAERTSSATTEIEEVLVGIQGETGAAVGAMNAALPEVQEGVQRASSAVELLRAIEVGARHTLERVGDVASATREQSMASTSIAQRVEQIAGMVEDTHQATRETKDNARQLEGIAQNLKQQIARFQV